MNHAVDNNSTALLIEELRARAKRLRRSAAFFLAIILAAIGSGLLIFLYAKVFTGEQPVIPGYTKIAEIEDSLRSSLNFGVHQTDSARRLLESLRLDNEAKIAVEAAIGKLGSSSSYMSDSYRTLATLDEALSSREVQILELGKVLDDERRKKSDRLDVNSMIVRFTITVLLLFLVRILLQAYRYNLSLSAFYDARADSLHLKGPAGFDAATLKLFNPKDHHFGAMPASPILQLGGVARSVAQGLQPTPRPTSVARLVEATVEQDLPPVNAASQCAAGDFGEVGHADSRLR